MSVGHDRFILSVNPSTEPPGTQYGRCDPHLLRFDIRNPAQSARRAPAALAEIGPFHRSLVPGHRRRWPARRGPAPEHRRDHQHPALGLWAGRRNIPAHGNDHVSDPGLLSPGCTARPRGARAWPSATSSSRTRNGKPTRSRRPAATGTTSSAGSSTRGRPTSRKTDFAEPIEVDSADATGGHISNLDLWIDPEAPRTCST